MSTTNFAWPTQEQFWNSFLSLPEEKRQILIDRQKIKTGNHEFDLFAKYTIPAMNPALRGGKLEIPDIHKKWWGHIDSSDSFVAVFAPVGFSKSSVIRTYIIKLLLIDNVRYLLYVGSTKDAIQQHLSAVKACLQDSDMQALFNYTITEDNKTSLIIRKADGRTAKIWCVSPKTTGVLGTNFEGTRPDAIIIDDIQSLSQAKSVSQTNEVHDFLQSTLLTRLDGLNNGKVRLVGTLLTKNSLNYRICHNIPTDTGSQPYKRWKVYRYSAFTEQGESIWPAKFTTEALLQKQQDDPTNFAKDYLNDPVDPSDSIIAAHQLNYYNQRHFNYKSIVECYAHFDLASSLKEKADYFAGQVWGRTDKGKLYLLDIIHGKFDPGTQAEIVIKTWLEWSQRANLSLISFDSVSYQKTLKFWVDKLASERYIKIRIEESKWRGDKWDHLISHEPFFTNENQLINLPESHPHLAAFKQELLGFPNEQHDDLLDAMCGALDHFRGKKPARRSVPAANNVFKKL